MNVIVLGKLHDGVIHVLEHEDSEGLWSAIKYGDWAGSWDVDWYRYESASGDGYVRYPFDPDFKLTDCPLVPVAYEGQYCLVVLMGDHDLDDNERLVKVGPASPKLVKETLADMWGK